MLRINDLRVRHGPIEVVHGVSFEVKSGQCVALLGPNGAGKTSTLSAITGTAKCVGSIVFNDKEIIDTPIETRISDGISISPEGRRVFANLTVRENLLLGGAVRKKTRSIEKNAEKWLQTFPVLNQRQDQLAGTLSGGEQQMLAIARALMVQPKILLLDEPSLGLAPKIMRQIFGIIENLKEQGTTILLVEQNATQALRLADYAYLMNNGELAASGTTKTLGTNTSLMAELTGIT